jgi:hypothetical protein
MPRFQPSYGEIAIPGTSIRLSNKSAAGFVVLMGLGYGVYRYMRARA